MRQNPKVTFILLIIVLWTFLSMKPRTCNAQDPAPPGALPRGVYIELTADFYRALKGDATGGDRVYGHTKSDEYLRRISVSTQFMVETNLKIIRQQEKIIQLMTSMAKMKNE